MSNLARHLKEKWPWLAFWTGLILLVSLSFGAGYLTGRDSGRAPIVIEKCPTAR